MALARSVDLSWSPAPYWGPMISMSGYASVMRLTKPSLRSMPVRLVWSWMMTPTLPAPPMSSAILSAARAAAATLSVAAVVMGMSLSTPESNAMTGMPLSLALLEQRVGRLAVERREAEGVRVLVELGLQHVDLLGDLGLAGRADEVHLGVEGRALILGALLDGLPELVLEALRDDRDVRLGVVRERHRLGGGRCGARVCGRARVLRHGWHGQHGRQGE